MMQEESAADRRPRVAIVVSHPIQHFCPLYRGLKDDGRLDVKVAFGSRAGVDAYYDPGFGRTVQWQADILDGYEHEFLPGASDIRDLGASIRNAHIPALLNRWLPDVVQVYGFHHGISRQAIAWARGRGRRVLYVSDSDIRNPMSTLARVRKRLTLPSLFATVDGFLTIGDCNEAYYLSYGVGRERLFRCPLTVDEERLQAADGEPSVRRQLRSDLGIPPNVLLAIMVGKLRREKCPEHVLEAMSLLRARQSPAAERLAVAFVGDGPEMRRMQALARERALENMHFPGFASMDILPRYYAAADFLIHPSSQDHHPLVISEAIVCGLPVVVSDRVGSVGPTDDMRPGVNGIEYPFGNLAVLADAIERLVLDEGFRKRMGEGSRRIALCRRKSASIDGYVKAVDAVLRAPPGAGGRAAALFFELMW